MRPSRVDIFGFGSSNLSGQDLQQKLKNWIGYNVLDWFMRDMTRRSSRGRSCSRNGNGKPSSQIRAEYGILRSTLRRWVQGIRNSGSTKAADNRTPEENELIELRKRDRQLEMEVDVSEQAAPVFARKQA